MKFKYKIQPYQTEAVESVVRVFDGQPYLDATLYQRDLGELQPNTVDPQKALFAADNDTESGASGFKNGDLVYTLNDDALLGNIRKIQAERNIPLVKSLSKIHGCCALDIEMETGTGKTYVYIKTMFELNKRYGWTKFIVICRRLRFARACSRALRT